MVFSSFAGIVTEVLMWIGCVVFAGVLTLMITVAGEHVFAMVSRMSKEEDRKPGNLRSKSCITEEHQKALERSAAEAMLMMRYNKNKEL